MQGVELMVMAIRVHRVGGPEEMAWEDVGSVVCERGQVLVSNTAIAVNMLDVYQRSGRPHPSGPRFPYVPGSVNVGVLEDTGAMPPGLQPGMRVVCMGAFGAYSAQTAVDADRVIPLPDDIADHDAAAMYVRGLTAYYLTHLHHEIRPGQQLLVHAAAGGLGQLLSRWATALGAEVIGTVSKPEKQRIAEDAGCVRVLVRNGADWVAGCLAVTQQGVEVAYDSIGRDTIQDTLRCIRPGGRAIVCGAASGTVEHLSLEWLHAGSLSVSRPTVMTYVRTREQLQEASAAVFAAMRRGILRLSGIEAYPLRDAHRAHRSLESGQARHTPILLP